MRISVIMPCHNAGAWIASALGSISQQSYPPQEIIVIDDGSTDDSVAQIEGSGVHVRLLHCSGHNAAATRNVGIAAATGDWLAFLDADDIWYPDHLARAVGLLKRTEDVAFMSNHDWVGLDGQVIQIPEEFQCKLPAPAAELTVEEFFEISEAGFHFGHSTVLYRRDRVLEVGMFDASQRRRHDVDLWLRVIANCTWTYDTVKSAGYREGVPKSLSKDREECDYYYLRALVKNLRSINCPPARHHLARQARRAMGFAFVDGVPEHYARISKIAWPYLPVPFKLFYRCGTYCAPPLRMLMRARRQILMNPDQMEPKVAP
jgi:glycosyltransferase involved in cell wall biosynthesis